VDRNNIWKFFLTSYAAKYRVSHVKFEVISSDIQYVMEYVFDKIHKDKSHSAAWLQLRNMNDSFNSFRGSCSPSRSLVVRNVMGLRYYTVTLRYVISMTAKGPMHIHKM
jgi:hypothetical protein